MSETTHSPRPARTAALILGAIGASVTLSVMVSMWWLSLVLAVVTLGALYEIWRSSSRLAPSRATVPVLVLTVVLTAVGLAAALGLLPTALAWSGCVAFAVAWAEHIVAMASDSSRSRPSAV